MASAGVFSPGPESVAQAPGQAPRDTPIFHPHLVAIFVWQALGPGNTPGLVGNVR